LLRAGWHAPKSIRAHPLSTRNMGCDAHGF